MLSRQQLHILKDYTIRHLIGQGTFAKVYEAERLANNTHHAVKVIPKILKKETQAEIDLVSHFDHPSLLKFDEVLTDDNYDYLVTELLPNGTLLRHLNHRSFFPERDARLLFKDMFDGLCYLHEIVGVAHLDLKLENVMIDSNSRARIIDFGSACPFSTLMKTTLKCGSHPYCSPEMLTGQIVTSKTDIWSLGVLLYTLVVGQFPFCAVDESLLTSKIVFDEVTFPTTASDEFKDLVQKMLEKDPTKRITLSGIASHPWVIGGVLELPHLSAVSVPFFPCLLRPSLQPLKVAVMPGTGMTKSKVVSQNRSQKRGLRPSVQLGRWSKIIVR
jgi:serine/threonine protein kinase